MEVIYWILFGAAGAVTAVGGAIGITKLAKYISAKRAQKAAKEAELLKAIAEKNKNKGLTPTQLKSMVKQARKEQEKAAKTEKTARKKLSQVKDALVEKGAKVVHKGAALKDTLKEKHAQFKEVQEANKKNYRDKKQIDIDQVKLVSENDDYFNNRIVGAKVQEATALREKGLKNLTKEQKARLAQLEKELSNYLSVNNPDLPLKPEKVRKAKEVAVANVLTTERDPYTNDIMNTKHARYEELLTKGRKNLTEKEKTELNTIHQEIEEFLEDHPTYEFEKGDLTQAPHAEHDGTVRRAPARPSLSATSISKETQNETITHSESEVERIHDNTAEITKEELGANLQSSSIEEEYEYAPSTIEKLKKGKKATNLIKKIFKEHPEIANQYQEQSNEATRNRNDGTGAIS